MPTKKKPQVTASPERRRELLDTAAEVFAEQGYNATTVRKIADQAGMLAGSLYYHFDSKESMLEEILRTFLDELWDGYDTVLDAELGPGKPWRPWSPSHSGRSTGTAPPSRSTRRSPDTSPRSSASRSSPSRSATSRRRG